ncbi:MAG: GNAT family N-acetyltransferase [Bernardetiaceae bacterium]|jgi:ribosomal protein S18 acetylase RimI-like enzyme|nr:GNAT family N-acetyltransferase [Bernardetiaceae bacterium]
MSNLQIVRATPAHLDLLREIGQATYRDHYAYLWTEPGLNQYLDRQFGATSPLATDLAGQTVQYHLAQTAHETVGFVKLKLAQPLPGQLDAVGLELEKIYLRRQAVGQGYGEQLLRAVADIARQTQHQWVWLDVLKTNHRGIAFYERAGFRTVGEVPFASDREAPGMWVMAKRLGASP